MLLNLHGELAEQLSSSDMKNGKTASSQQQGNIYEHRKFLPVGITPAGG